jgi:hypothetical protein
MREERQLEKYEKPSDHAGAQFRDEEGDNTMSSLHEEEKRNSLDQLLSKAIREKNGHHDSQGNSSAHHIRLTVVIYSKRG